MTHLSRPTVRTYRQAELETIGLDAGYISTLVETFYGRIQADPVLGPIFARHVQDWPEHLDRMKSFWRSILHSTGEFSGSPMLKHIMIGGLDRAHFAHWLTLFYATLQDIEPHPTVTQLVAARARTIAESLLGGIAAHGNGAALHVGNTLPVYVPPSDGQ